MCGVGDKVLTERYGYFTVKDIVSEGYLIEFDKTKYRTVVGKRRVKDGLVKDRLSPSILGVACIGESTKKGNERVYKLWHSMITRCYNKTHPSYKYYGAKGVTVSSRWLNFSNFLEDYGSLEIRAESGNEGDLELDKDVKQPNLPENEKVYSPETCLLVSKRINQMHRSSSIRFTATSPTGVVYEDIDVIDLLGISEEMNVRCVYHCIEGKQKAHRGWVFERRINEKEKI